MSESSVSPRTVTVLFGALALVMYMATQNQELVVQSHAFRGAAGAETIVMQSADLSSQIRSRQALVTQLKIANQDLIRQQDKLLSQAQTGDLARVLRDDAAPAAPAAVVPPAAPAAFAVAAPVSAAVAAAPVVVGPPAAAPPQAQAQAAPKPAAGMPSGLVAFFNKHSQLHLSVTLDEGQEFTWLQCNGDETVALSQKTFEVVPVDQEWFALKNLATNKYLEMVAPNQPLAWVLRSSSVSLSAQNHFRYQAGGLFNRGNSAFINIIADARPLAVRGHGNTPNKHLGAQNEPTTQLEIQQVTPDLLQQDAQTEVKRKQMAFDQEKDYISQIAALPRSSEKRVVSYGLYGSNPKYTHGAIRNSELVKVYFPGWVCRFYCGSDVPKDILNTLRQNGAEIVMITNIKGGIAGMFWRFLVADDSTVDRWIVRDSDSRLNPRERFAVEEWILSGKAVHTIRDHPNHDRTLNGGLWGGTKGAIKGMSKMVQAFGNKNSYGGDLQFLMTEIWPLVKNNQIGHDAYTCTKYPNSHPFPTKRPTNYQHVGQVFDANDNFRAKDINGFMRGVQIPHQCRKHAEWKYG